MNPQQVLAIMALPWQAAPIGLDRYILTHPDCLGSIVFDEGEQIIFPSNHFSPTAEQIRDDLTFYQIQKMPLNAARVLQCEGNALSNFKKPGRYYPNIFKLFRALEEKANKGTEAVFAHRYQDLDGIHKLAWIRIEWDERCETLARFEKAIADLKSAVNEGNEEKIARAENMLKYLTGVSWSRTEKVLKVGRLADSYGWQWLTDASFCSEEELEDYGYDSECDVIRCTCGFFQSVAWELGYTGQYVAELHWAFQIHNEKHPNCQGDLR